MKRFQRIGLSVAVALGMLTMVPGAVFAAQPACGDTLLANTTLTADLDCSAYAGTGLYLAAKGITLNLNGHTIWGWTGADSYSGVDTNYKKHTTIKNGTIANFDVEVYLDQSVGGTVKNLTLIGEAADTNDTGVYVYYGTTNTVTNLDISGHEYGFYLYGSAENWITNNDIAAETYGAYAEYESNDQIIGNTITTYDYAGWYDDYGSHQVYKNNSADGDLGAGYYGFYLDCSDYGWAKVTNNTAMNNTYYGFYFYYCYDDSNQQYGSTFSGNVATDNDDGSGGGIGFYDSYSVNSTWTNNTAKRNGDEGFYLDYPGLVVFKWNVANKNGGDGIYVGSNYGSGYGNFTTFAGNTANWNGSYGIDGEYGITGASGNKAHNNGNAPDDCYNVDCN